MTRAMFSSLSIASIALGMLSAACTASPQDVEPSATGSAAVQTALHRVMKCPPGEELTCDPTQNGHGVICDCAYPPPAFVRAESDVEPEILHKCPPGEELTCDPTQNGHGVICDCAYPPPAIVRAGEDVQPEILQKCPPGEELTCDPTQNGRGVICDCAYPPPP